MVIESVFYVASFALAVFGLNTWRRELHAKAVHDAAKNLLAGALSVRDSIKRARAPVMLAQEWAGLPDRSYTNPNQKRANESYLAYTLGSIVSSIHSKVGTAQH